MRYYYYYLYKVYNLMEYFKPNGVGNKFRAILLMTLVELWFVFGLYNYFDLITKERTIINLLSVSSLPFIAIFIIQCTAFVWNKSWENYVKEFENWDMENNKMGTRIVIIVTIFVVVSSIISTYLISNMPTS